MIEITTLNLVLGLGTLAMQIASIALVIVLIFRNRLPFSGDIMHIVGRYGLMLSFLLFLSGMLLSLYYSEVLGVAPCGLCWVQRIFMYPQVVLLGMALWKKETRIVDYSVALSVLGGLTALYQHFLQIGGQGFLPCPAVSLTDAADCSKRIIFEFGYITFPLIAFSVFTFAIILMLYVKKHAAESRS